MINKSDFTKLQKEIESFDNAREKLIGKSRDVVQLSKKVIYAVHRDQIHEAEKYRDSMKKELAALKKLAEPHHALETSGSFNIAEQEFVEAACFLDFAKNGKITPHSDLQVSIEAYLLGICDLTGELLRKGINDSIKGNYQTTVAIKDVVAELYGELMQFDFRNGEIRRKFDSIKYALNKLEDVVLELKLGGKI